MATVSVKWLMEIMWCNCWYTNVDGACTFSWATIRLCCDRWDASRRQTRKTVVKRSMSATLQRRTGTTRCVPSLSSPRNTTVSDGVRCEFDRSLRPALATAWVETPRPQVTTVLSLQTAVHGERLPSRRPGTLQRALPEYRDRTAKYWK